MAPVTSTLGLVIALSLGVFGFSPDTSGRAVAKPPAGPGVAAARVQGSVEIDGRLSEPAWAAAEPFTEFQQRSPHEGAPATLRTEVRVLYDDDAIYVGARLLDTAPDSILARLARRDDSISSDLFTLYLDPFHDRRSGYYFKINAAGTLYDGTLSNDVDRTSRGTACGAGRPEWTSRAGPPRCGSLTRSSGSRGTTVRSGASTSGARSRGGARTTTRPIRGARRAASCRASRIWSASRSSPRRVAELN